VATLDYAETWRFCIRSQQRFASKRGYKHKILDGMVHGLHPKWAKLQYVIDELRAGHHVLMIDADAQIRSTAPDPTELFPMGGDIFCVNGHSGRINSGFMLFRAGEDSRAIKYLQQCLDTRGLPVLSENYVTAEGENGHIIQVAKEPEFAERITLLDSAWNCTTPEGERDAYILHYTSRLRKKLNSEGVAAANEARTVLERMKATVERGRNRVQQIVRFRLKSAIK